LLPFPFSPSHYGTIHYTDLNIFLVLEMETVHLTQYFYN
jgi:hypothetical protein